MKNIILIFALISFSFCYSQKQIKYNFSIDKNNISKVINTIKNDIGEISNVKNKTTFWIKKNNEFEYNISIKKNKIKFLYKGTDKLIEAKLKLLYSKIKNE